MTVFCIVRLRQFNQIEIDWTNIIEFPDSNCFIRVIINSRHKLQPIAMTKKGGQKKENENGYDD